MERPRDHSAQVGSSDTPEEGLRTKSMLVHEEQMRAEGWLYTLETRKKIWELMIAYGHPPRTEPKASLIMKCRRQVWEEEVRRRDDIWPDVEQSIPTQ